MGLIKFQGGNNMIDINPQFMGELKEELLKKMGDLTGTTHLQTDNLMIAKFLCPPLPGMK
jgi:hypothetical protein